MSRQGTPHQQALYFGHVLPQSHSPGVACPTTMSRLPGKSQVTNRCKGPSNAVRLPHFLHLGTAYMLRSRNSIRIAGTGIASPSAQKKARSVVPAHFLLTGTRQPICVLHSPHANTTNRVISLRISTSFATTSTSCFTLVTISMSTRVATTASVRIPVMKSNCSMTIGIDTRSIEQTPTCKQHTPPSRGS